MGQQYKSIHLPVGYSVDIKSASDPDWVSLGVTANEGSLEFTYDAIKVTGSQAEGVLNFVKNMVMNAGFSLYQLELSNINRLMAGATSYSQTAATPVAVDDEDYLTGDWALDTFIPFKNQSGAGTVPTSISVVNDGTLTLDTDYLVIQSGGKWGIVVLDTVSTDTDETLEVNYTYTPSASRKLTAGSRAVDVQTRALRLRKELATGKFWTVEIYAATNTAGLSFSLPRFDADEPAILEVTMEGQLDTTRSDMDQLFSITDEFGTEDI